MSKTKAIDFDDRPKDEEGRTMVRRIRMHEFLMDGGVVTGRDDKGHVTYSGPITVDEYPTCPWHGEECEAWIEIVEGRGEWTRMEAELAEVQAEFLRTGDMDLSDRADELEAKLEMRPRTVRQLRERTDEEIAAERAAHIQRQNPSVYAPAPRQGIGNPWDRKPTSPSGYSGYIEDGSYRPKPKKYVPVEPDSRDVAAGVFAAETLPDEIEVDGAEGEEGDE